MALATGLGLERLDAQLLLLHALGRPQHDRAWLLAHDDDALTPALAQSFAALVQRRAEGEPLAYLTGSKAFYGMELQVSPAVLIPRPDTETLVDWALELLPPGRPARLLDLGTGSGAIALALGQQRPDARIHALDFSAAALQVAQANAQALGLQLQWHQGCWLQGLNERGFDVIVSNPPYIAEGDSHLEALRHEPLSALVSGADGLDDIRTILASAPGHLAPQGWLLFEHGYDQAEKLRAMLAGHGFQAVQSRRDLAGVERCTGGQWPGCA